MSMRGSKDPCRVAFLGCIFVLRLRYNFVMFKNIIKLLLRLCWKAEIQKFYFARSETISSKVSREIRLSIILFRGIKIVYYIGNRKPIRKGIPSEKSI